MEGCGQSETLEATSSLSYCSRARQRGRGSLWQCSTSESTADTYSYTTAGGKEDRFLTYQYTDADGYFKRLEIMKIRANSKLENN